MIPVREVSKGQFERLSGNPTLDSLDGKERAPLAVLLHSSWSDEERAKFGVFLAEPFIAPEGKRPAGDVAFKRSGKKIVEVREIQDAPAPMTVEARLAELGIPLKDLKAALGNV